MTREEWLKDIGGYTNEANNEINIDSSGKYHPHIWYYYLEEWNISDYDCCDLVRVLDFERDTCYTYLLDGGLQFFDKKVVDSLAYENKILNEDLEDAKKYKWGGEE